MNQPTIGAQIKTLRSMRGISQVKLAKLSGLRQDLISDFECERAAPSPSSLEAIEAALGIKFSDPHVKAAFAVLAGGGDRASCHPAGDGHGQELPNAS